MSASRLILQQEPPLKEFTEQVRRNVAITWYRTKLPPEAVKSLHAKSDVRGGIQTFGYLALLLAAAGLAIFSFHHWPWWATAACVFLYGMFAAFLINAVHELGHGTVFNVRVSGLWFMAVLPLQ